MDYEIANASTPRELSIDNSSSSNENADEEMFERARNDLARNDQAPSQFKHQQSPSNRISVSFDSTYKWKLSLYRDFSYNNVLHQGDIIWINSIQNCLNLSVISLNDNPTLADSERYYSLIFKQGGQVKLHDKDSKFGMINSLWVVEGRNVRNGGAISRDTIILFRNLVTNKYLGINRDDPSDQNHYKASLYDLPSGLCYFYIQGIYNFLNTKAGVNLKHILPDTFISLRLVEQKAWLSFYERSQNNKNNDLNYQSRQSNSIRSVKNSLIVTNQRNEYYDDRGSIVPIFERVYNDGQAFKIIKASRQDLLEATYLLTDFPKLIKCSQRIFENSILEIRFDNHFEIEKSINEEEDLIKLLKTLSYFCLNMSFSDYRQGNTSTSDRQLTLAEMGIFEILVKIIKVWFPFDLLQQSAKKNTEILNSFANSTIGIDSGLNSLLSPEEKRKSKIKANLKRRLKVVECALILFSLVAKNQQNLHERAATAFKQIIYLCYNLKIATDCIISIVGENISLIKTISEDAIKILNTESNNKSSGWFRKMFENKIHSLDDNSNDQINYLIFYFGLISCKELYSDPNPIRFLRAICTFDGNGVKEVQDAVYEIINSDVELEERLFVPISIANQDLMVRYNDKNLPLDKYIASNAIMQSHKVNLHLNSGIFDTTNLSILRSFYE